MNVRLLACFLFLFVLFSPSRAQDTERVIDSLKNQLALVVEKDYPETCFNLAEKYRRIHLDSAYKYANLGLESAFSNKDDEAIAKAYDILGRINHGKGQYILAAKYFENGLIKARELGNDALIMHMKNSMGISHATAGQYEEALRYFLDVHQAFVDEDKEFQAIQVLSNIASLYKNIGQYDKAIHAYEESLEIARKIEKFRLITKCLSGLGDVYEKLQIYDKALEYQEQSLTYGKEKNYQPQVLASMESIGRLWVMKGEPDLGRSFFEQALDIAYQEGSKQMIQLLLMDLGELAEEQGDLSQGLENYMQSLEIARQMNALPKMQELELKISEIYVERENHLEAYNHFLRHTQIKEQIFNQQNNLHIEEIEAKYELERKEEEMEKQREEIARLTELEKSKQRQLYALWVVAVLFVTLLIALYSRFRIKHKVNEVLAKQNVEIQQQNDLLEIKSGEIQAQNQLLEEQSEAIKAQNAKLKQANSDLEQFAYAASHDLREPLRTISSYIELLKIRYMDQLDEDARDFIDFASSGAVRMDELLKDLLAYSRIGRKSVHTERVNLNLVVNNVLEDLTVQIQEHEAKIELEKLPYISGFDAEIQLLFQNLISNAIKFRRKGISPHIRISAVQIGNEWRISVADNGIGMSTAYQEKVFTLFQRLHTREQYEGTGIGLAMCKKIVENHGGKIWFESEKGRGTTFFISLPDPSNRTDN